MSENERQRLLEQRSVLLGKLLNPQISDNDRNAVQKTIDEIDRQLNQHKQSRVGWLS